MPASRASIRCSRWRIQTGTSRSMSTDGYSKRRSGFRALYCEARWRTHHLDLLDRRAARHQVRSLLLGD
jgi:hypothetical protein